MKSWLIVLFICLIVLNATIILIIRTAVNTKRNINTLIDANIMFLLLYWMIYLLYVRIRPITKKTGASEIELSSYTSSDHNDDDVVNKLVAPNIYLSQVQQFIKQSSSSFLTPDQVTYLSNLIQNQA